MNMFETMVRMRIDDLVGLADRVRRERDLKAGFDAGEATVMAAAAGATPEATRPARATALSGNSESDCPECPSSVQAA